MEVIDYIAVEEAQKQSRKEHRARLKALYECEPADYMPTVVTNPVLEQQVARFVEQLDAAMFVGYKV